MTAFNHHHLAAALMATTALVSAPAGAQTALDQTREFSVQAGPLEDVLLSVADQSRIQLLYPSDLLPPSRTAGISGAMSVRQALERVLAGTGLQWRESRPGVIVITRAQPVRTQNDPDAVTVEAVTVTGTLLPGSGGPASPVVMLSRSDMDRAGYGGVADALNALPQNQGGVGTPAALLTGADPLGVNVGLANGVNLRGLGPDATLILVNGRRMAGSGLQGDFSDVSALPAAAVERMDILLDGASALYGSDAVGGVVNVILRRGFDGQETRARVSGFDGGHDWSLAHTLGRRWSSGSALLSYETRRSAALNADDRTYARTGDLRPFGGSDRRQFYAAPGNIMGINAAGTGYEALWAIRPQADGTAAFAAGETNLAFRQAGIDILPEQEVHSGYAHVDLNPAPWLRLSADFRLNDRSFAYRSLSPAGIATVTAANPYFQSPTGAASHQVAYNFLDEAGSSWARGASVSQGASVGFEADFGGAGQLDVYAAWASEDSDSRQTGMLHNLRLNEALGTAPDNPDTAFNTAQDGFLNLFSSGQANSPAVIDFITSGYFRSRNRSETASLNGLYRQNLLELGGGPLDLAVGGQLRKERFSQASETFLYSADPAVTTRPAYQRNSGAVFAELRAPFISSLNARPGVQRLELSLAARHEDYDDVGSTTTPKVGLIWSPSEGLILRSTWGESFRAPPLTAVAAPSQITVVSVPDGATSRLALLEIGGNPDLEPEQAESFTLGFDAEPAPGWRMSMTWFDVRFEGRIGRPGMEGYETAFLDPALAPFAQRLDPSDPQDRARLQALLDSPGYLFPGLFPIEAFSAAIDGRWVNAASVQVRGLDAQAGYQFGAWGGTVDLEGRASYVADYLRQLTPAAPADDVAGRQGFPADLRARFSASWSGTVMDAVAAINHVAAYHDAAGDRIDAWTTLDLQLGWSPPSGVLEGLSVSFGVRNLLDQDPPFFNAPSGFGFDPGQADPYGRTAYLQLIKRW